MARTSIWASMATGGRKPITDNLPEEEKNRLYRENFIEDVLYGIDRNRELPTWLLAQHSEKLSLSEAALKRIEELLWVSEPHEKDCKCLLVE